MNMPNGKTQLLQKGRTAQIAREAKAAKEDIELYSKKDFREAVEQAESDKVNKYKSVKEFVRKNGK